MDDWIASKKIIFSANVSFVNKIIGENFISLKGFYISYL